MAHPLRIQRRRARGWRLPAGAKCVTRPGRWGNPFKTAEEFRTSLIAARFLVMKYVRLERPSKIQRHMIWIAQHVHELKGLKLACWCGNKPCHADVLCEIANKEGNGK